MITQIKCPRSLDLIYIVNHVYIFLRVILSDNSLMYRRHCTKFHNDISIKFEEKQILLDVTKFLACQLC